MRCLTWNIRHGGKSPALLARAIGELKPDVAIVTEFRSTQRGQDLVAALKTEGLTHTSFEPLSITNGVLIASRTPIRPDSEVAPQGHAHRWRHVHLSEMDIAFLGIYLPVASGLANYRAEKQRFWDQLLVAAERLLPTNAIIMGDFNTGAHLTDEEGKTFICSNSFRRLSDLGWLDAYRAVNGDRRQYSWWSATSGFRLDHAFLSPTFAGRLLNASYVTQTPQTHLVHPIPKRNQSALPPALSDHAALLVEIA